MTADEVIDATMDDWRDLWDRRPALYCPNCGRVDTMLIHTATGYGVIVRCAECK